MSSNDTAGGDACAVRPADHPCRVILALQGGGSHGAFTWGVLDRLLDEDIWIDAVSGTSAGAVNSVALASGLVEGGRPGAQEALKRVWEAVGRAGTWVSSPLEAVFADTAAAPLAKAATKWQKAAFGPMLKFQQAQAKWWGKSLAQTFSPYQTNPLGLNPLEKILAENVNFDAVHECDSVRLYIAATQVKTGRLRVFDRAHVTRDVVLASACLPTLFQAVEVEGEAYWDGGYAGNPSLLPMVTETDASDLLIVQINPIQRSTEPRSAPEILDRMNEITFNSTLLKELRMFSLLAQLADKNAEAAHPLMRRLAELNLHRIDGGPDLAEFGAASKLDAGMASLQKLHDLGWQRADEWLATHRDDLAVRSTLDLGDYTPWPMDIEA